MNEFLKFIVDNWVSLSSTIGMIVLWFSKRKYDKVEFKKETSTALEGIANAYDRYVANTNAKVEELQKEINDLKEREKDWLIEKLNEKYKIVKEKNIWFDEDEKCYLHLKIANKKCYVILMRIP